MMDIKTEVLDSLLRKWEGQNFKEYGQIKNEKEGAEDQQGIGIRAGRKQCIEDLVALIKLFTS